MKYLIISICFSLFILICNAQTKGVYVSDLRSHNYNGWDLKKGVEISFKDKSTGTISNLKKYKSEGKYLIFVSVTKTDGTKVIIDLDEGVKTEYILLPKGIKKRNAIENDYQKFNRDSIIHNWALDILPVKDGKINYTAIIDVPNTNKEEIYYRAKIWFVRSFKDSKEVLQLDDKVQGKIIGKGHSTVYWSYSGFAMPIEMALQQLFDVSIKDNKARIIITDISGKYYVNSGSGFVGGWQEINLNHYANGNNKVYRIKNTKKLLSTIDNDIQETINSFESFLNNPTISTNSTGEDW